MSGLLDKIDLIYEKLIIKQEKDFQSNILPVTNIEKEIFDGLDYKSKISIIIIFIIMNAAYDLKMTLSSNFLKTKEINGISLYLSLIVCSVHLILKNILEIEIVEMQIKIHKSVFITFKEEELAEIIKEGNSLSKDFLKSKDQRALNFLQEIKDSILVYFNECGEDVKKDDVEINFSKLFKTQMDQCISLIEY